MYLKQTKTQTTKTFEESIKEIESENCNSILEWGAKLCSVKVNEKKGLK